MKKNSFKINVYDAGDVASISVACKLASKTLDYLESQVRVGVTTKRLDELCEKFILDHGGIPACKGYQGFPASLCTSVNSVACHGVPDDVPLQDGDIINLDVVVNLNGWHGDTSRTFPVGTVAQRHLDLINIARKAMYVGIEAIKPGSRFNDIGIAVSRYINSKKGFCLIKEFCGHGIGRQMHEEPLVLHFPISKSTSLIEPGMCFTIEPIVSCGSSNTIQMKDGWTMVTTDRSFASQFEHTIFIDEEYRPNILT
ncbi:MAG: type I methionyl aminopeptidase [Alphaproteobacteria bacterium]|nr:MAG: type I methionyl aminopeptidase [Alphaproteobacteria bacterium]